MNSLVKNSSTNDERERFHDSVNSLRFSQSATIMNLSENNNTVNTLAGDDVETVGNNPGFIKTAVSLIEYRIGEFLRFNITTRTRVKWSM